MTLRISGKGLDVGTALRERISTRLDEILNKYFDRSYSGHVTIEHEGYGFRTECSLHLDSGMVLQSEGLAADAYASFDQAAEKIAKRLRRYKRKLRDHRAKTDARDKVQEASYVVFQAVNEDHEEQPEGDFHPITIAESVKQCKTLTVGAAVEELDLTGVPVVVFRNAGNSRINVVYRRADGNVGWIDPPTE